MKSRDGGRVVREYTASGSAVWDKDYVYLGGRLLATETSAGGTSRRYYHPDRLGTRLVTNASGAALDNLLNLPFGTAIDVTATNRRFTSYDRGGATGQDNAVNRTYSAGHGRFTQSDPIGITVVSLDNLQTLNLYAYCGNDPINQTDPVNQSLHAKARLVLVHLFVPVRQLSAQGFGFFLLLIKQIAPLAGIAFKVE
jgi:RHS repeat-associated protein